MTMSLKPWHLILIGIAMNIVASVLSHIQLDKLQQNLANIDYQTANIDTRIDGLWQRHLEADRNKHLALSLYSHVDDDAFATHVIGAPAYSFLKHYLESISQAELSVPDLPGLMTLLNEYQSGLRDQIDDLYFERIELLDARTPIQMRSNRTKNIALFLQLMGLILVLSKDLAKRD